MSNCKQALDALRAIREVLLGDMVYGDLSLENLPVLVRTLKEERDSLQAELADWKDGVAGAMDESCGTEKHCTCVPLLRAEVKRLTAENERLKNERTNAILGAQEPTP
jgi:hypothetical protein